ncbi:hypothetical protein O6H91_01G152300 [Diphasiastrum complanatum]|uniref:Uncharacterized protein n=1 Tax=Diphasiastrum complanatum TaxID=34168 RepID=A0ACC2EXC9_DIPCM|nr:hypothetical protein O6H91_01G152300 [Diphasiastrum complanatum]
MKTQESKKVVIKSRQTVVPIEPTPRPRTHYLSNLDLLYSDIIINNVYYFPPFSNVNDSGELIQGLKDSLAKVLVHYPVLAGRVRTGEDGRRYIDCSDEGILLVEATADARFDEWKDLINFPMEPYLNLGDSVITDFSTAPLLRIQVTLFGCGGVAIGYGFAHIVIDGWSATEFMKAWSEVHRELPISINPTFATELLKARSPPSVKQPVNDYLFFPKIPSDASSPAEAPSTATAPATKLAITTFYFSADEVNALVQEVENGPWAYDRPTSFEALEALCWKAMTEVRDLPDDVITTYSYPINVRGRWDPALPSGYFGNGPHLSCLGVKAGDIKHNHLSYVAKLIRDDIKASGLEYLRSVIDLLEIEMNQGKAVDFNSAFYAGTDVQGTNFATFPIYEVDFGSGKPLHFSFYLHPLFGNGLAHVLPTPHGGRSRYVPMSMSEEHMKKLLENKLFTNFLAGARHAKLVSFG